MERVGGGWGGGSASEYPPGTYPFCDRVKTEAATAANSATAT